MSNFDAEFILATVKAGAELEQDASTLNTDYYGMTPSFDTIEQPLGYPTYQNDGSTDASKMEERIQKATSLEADPLGYVIRKASQLTDDTDALTPQERAVLNDLLFNSLAGDLNS